MTRRSVSWEQGLAERLKKDPEFAHEFVRAALNEEGLSFQVVLGTAIRAYGVKEFAAKAGIPAPNVIRAINPKHNPTLETLNKLLKPFKLKLSVGPITRRRAA